MLTLQSKKHMCTCTLSGIKCWGHYFRYHNREAVVMSALQVEKHPISTPGPYATPPLQGRHFHAPGVGGFSALQMTPPLGIRDSPRAGSPIPRPGSGASGSYIGSPRTGDVYRRPHSSPKMKLRFTLTPGLVIYCSLYLFQASSYMFPY